MFIAGTETTTITMEWTMSLLLNHPEVMEEVRAEIVSHVGNEHLLNDSDLAKLSYLHCVYAQVISSGTGSVASLLV
ncbi:hypothetical protein V6N13_140616 [Hibiscus sabdariffa]|uniref:Cytochrome P450 n=1 Tax=Hibiscus sabdariffa TaxID=183260 RepID=A0ABR2BL64_9ROSI